ncbi:MAG: ATP-dependent DNA helicase RecG [Nitrospira sp.]|nr:ATP-dependent DNA helicase RecG [Nitrospira sp.]
MKNGADRNITRDTSVQYIKGVGPARARLLSRMGLSTVEDILYFFPSRYDDRREMKKINKLYQGMHETFKGEVIQAEIVLTPRKRMKIFELIIADDTGSIKAKWFNQPFLKRYFPIGSKVLLSGIVKGNMFAGGELEMENPDYELIGGSDVNIHAARIVPVYKATEGITPKQVRVFMFEVVSEYSSLIDEYLPSDILEKNNLQPLQTAVRQAHFPEGTVDMASLNTGASIYHRRLIFDEFFLLELGLALLKKRETAEAGISFDGSGELEAQFLNGLGFKLTDAQERVIAQIKTDMQRPLPMNRLLHGDVGCGKTVVALLSMLLAVESGYQACMMVPTELLAEQHYSIIMGFVQALGIKTVLLTSGTKDKPVDEIASGEADIIIGTHALIQKKVEFKKLGLAVIDEQHRFGVAQRAALRQKGETPDILIMTATPIPRTLAMTLYGDLDISVINELPSGRKAIVTKICFSSQKSAVFQKIEEQLEMGRQVYVVYPLIEESEKIDLKSAIDGAEALGRKYPDRKVGLVHGRMSRDERDAVMTRFKLGEINILVSTTVIEVGIDVPNASLMVIVHAERFGLAQLHQLRGRIGRGEYASYCLLLVYPPFSEEAKMRLKAMEFTSDGFKIAEEDLAIRGPGDFFGTRQSGIPELKIANILRDVDLLEIARKEAFKLADVDANLTGYPLLRQMLEKKWATKSDLIKS